MEMNCTMEQAVVRSFCFTRCTPRLILCSASPTFVDPSTACDEREVFNQLFIQVRKHWKALAIPII